MNQILKKNNYYVDKFESNLELIGGVNLVVDYIFNKIPYKKLENDII